MNERLLLLLLLLLLLATATGVLAQGPSEEELMASDICGETGGLTSRTFIDDLEVLGFANGTISIATEGYATVQTSCLTLCACGSKLTRSRGRSFSVSEPFSMELVPIVMALRRLFQDVDEVRTIVSQWPTGDFGDEQTDWVLRLSSPVIRPEEVSFAYETIEAVTTPLERSDGARRRRRRRLEGNTASMLWHKCEWQSEEFSCGASMMS